MSTATAKPAVQRRSTPKELAAQTSIDNDQDLRGEAEGESEILFTVTETSKRPGGVLHMPKMAELPLGVLRRLAKAQDSEDLDAMLAVFEEVMTDGDVELMNSLTLREFLGLMTQVGEAEGVTPGES